MPDQLTSGIHEKENTAQIWCQKFFKPLLAMSKEFTGLEVSPKSYTFKDREGNTIVITFKVVSRSDNTNPKK